MCKNVELSAFNDLIKTFETKECVKVTFLNNYSEVLFDNPLFHLRAYYDYDEINYDNLYKLLHRSLDKFLFDDVDYEKI